MTKQQFLQQLEKGLKSKHVSDISDILSDYEDYFHEQLALGKSEDMISLSLGDIESIIKDYHEHESVKGKSWFDLVAISFVALPLLMLSYGLLIGFIGLSFASWGIAIYYTFSLDSLSFMPVIPLTASWGFILAFLAFAVFMFSLSVRYFGVLKSMTKQYLVKQTIRIGDFPQSPIYQKLLIISGWVSLAFVTIGYLLAAFIAKDFQFWHTWEWFQ